MIPSLNLLLSIKYIYIYIVPKREEEEKEEAIPCQGMEVYSTNL